MDTQFLNNVSKDFYISKKKKTLLNLFQINAILLNFLFINVSTIINFFL